MTSEPTIASMVDALDREGADAVAALLPAGNAGAEVMHRLVDEAEGRIMADLARAVRTTGALARLADARGGDALRARAQRVHAQALTYANRFAEAISTLEGALRHADAARDLVEGGRVRLAMLHVHARQAKFDDAVRCGSEALGAFERAGERVMAGRAENNLGILERMRGRPGEAIPHFTRAAAALSGMPQLLAHVENNLAEAYLDLDQFARAERAFRGALASFRAAGADRHAGIVLGNLADLTSRQGRLHEALALFEEARRVLGDAAAPGDAARLAIEHAEVLENLGELERAADGLRGAIPVLESHAMLAEVARARLALGRTLARLGDPESEGLLRQAVEGFAAQGQAPGRARALAQTAESASLAGDQDGAARLLEEAREAVKDRPAALAWIDLLHSDVLRRSGRPADAASLAEHAADQAVALGVAPLAAGLLHAAGRARRLAGDTPAAARLLRRAVAEADRSRMSLQTNRFRSAFLGERAAIWEDAVSAVLDEGAAGCLEEAFALTESVRSRSLLDVLASGGSAGEEAAGDATLLAELSEVRSELESLYARAQDQADPARRAAMLADIRGREARAEAVVIRLGSLASYGGQLAGPAALPDLLEKLPAGAGLIEYFLEGGRVSAFVLGRGTARVHRRFASVEDVSRRLEGLRFQVGRALARGLPSGPKGARLAADAAVELSGLGVLLLDPLRAGLSGVGSLAVAPTGLLDAVPFPALSAGGLRLLDLPGLGVVPSASVLARLPAAGGGSALVVGFGDEAAPRADAEAHEVAAAMPGATVLTGVGATRRAFQDLSPGRSHVHFAGHARFIPTNPGASGLKLADGWLTAADLARLNLAGASVMLSGCDTGRAASAGGDERAGLARAVLSAGAASVTTTLWPVHDAETRGLMARAYAMVYGRGGSHGAGTRVIGRCLRACQKELFEAGAHAAVWAPFVTVCCPWTE